MIDPHGQPNAAYNKSRRKEKAACSLRGILQGVVADQNLSEQELLFLDVWLRSQSELDDPDFVLLIVKFTDNSHEYLVVFLLYLNLATALIF